ncbi:hypothetical protein D3C83_07400 [compost metagenome]
MEPQIGGFAHDLQFITALGGEHRFGGLLRELLQYRVLALGEQARHIGRRGVGLLARREHITQPLQYFRVRHRLFMLIHAYLYMSPGSFSTGSVITHLPPSSFWKKQL